MKRSTFTFLALLVLFAQIAIAKPVQKEVAPQPQDNSSPKVQVPAATASSAVDTTYLLGGPGSLDGSFETAAGQPDWHGWTHEDASTNPENHWHVSTYMADQIAGKGPGNHAMYCGDETIAACDPPDTVGGYGNGWLEEIEWIRTVADPAQPVTVRLTGDMNFDTEDAYDYVYLILQRGEFTEFLASWDGQGTAALDLTTVLSPGEFTGPNGNEIRLVWRFSSDASWDDIDCLFATRGACQIDDLSVYLDGNLITFDDFEPGNPVNWSPVILPGVGDFASLRKNLYSVHPCQSVNISYQVNFIDDGLVVPGTGGTPCINWCYGPNGWILNNDGGLLNDTDYHIVNRVISPPMAWPADADGAELAFDAYVHEFFIENVSGIYPFWWVRSTTSSNPDDLQNAPWVYRSFGGLTSPWGSYGRQIHEVSDLMVPDRQWAQVALGIWEFGFAQGPFDGPDGTPAPYFDNVAFKVWDPVGPDILVRQRDVFSDATPEAGVLDPIDLAANSCRIDAASSYRGARGDSLAAVINPLRHGAVVAGPPSLHWVMKCNPVFDAVRPAAPNPQGIVRGSVSSTMRNGPPDQVWWSFDLPDTGIFYPGDVLRYYILASDNLAGDIRTSVWPPDTTSILDFSPGSPYPLQNEIHGLPTVTQPTAGQFSHPPVLYVDDSEIDSQVRASWLEALEDLGYQYGDNLDILTIHYHSDFSEFATADILAGYSIILYSAGETNSSMDWNGPAVVVDWLATSGKKGIFAGQSLAQYLDRSINGSGQILNSVLGVDFISLPINTHNGGIWDLLISPVPGNGVLPDNTSWQVNAACTKIRLIDSIGTVGDGQSTATLDAEGYPGGPYSAVVTVDDMVLGNRTAMMPFDLDAVSGMTGGAANSDKVFSPATQLAYYLLAWLDTGLVSGTEDLPDVRRVTVTAHPNPFNPSTTIAFELPRAMDVSLDIYDLQGRLVRRLLDENPYVSGSHKQVWDGRNAGGQTTASGVYFYRFTAGDQKRVGKLTLLK